MYQAASILPARQVEKTAAFYRDVPGFKVQGVFREGDGPAFLAIVGQDRVAIGLQATAVMCHDL